MFFSHKILQLIKELSLLNETTELIIDEPLFQTYKMVPEDQLDSSFDIVLLYYMVIYVGENIKQR